MYLVSPKNISLKGEEAEITFVRNRMTACPDEGDRTRTGRRRFEAIPGSEFVMKASLVAVSYTHLWMDRFIYANPVSYKKFKEDKNKICIRDRYLSMMMGKSRGGIARTICLGQKAYFLPGQVNTLFSTQSMAK